MCLNITSSGTPNNISYIANVFGNKVDPHTHICPILGEVKFANITLFQIFAYL